MASRSFSDTKFTSANKPFITVFSSLFPLQTTSWKEFHLPSKISSKVISCLRGEQLEMALWHKIRGQEKNIGLTGKHTQNCTRKTHISSPAPTENKSSSSPLLLQGSGKASTANTSKLPFKRLLKRSQPSPRPANWLENHPLSSKQKRHTKSQWDGWWKDSDEKTLPQHHN